MNAQIKEAPRLGVFADEPAEAYYVRRLDEASNSGLAVIDERSPAHYRYWVENADDDADSEALAFGKALHCAFLEPERFGDCYGVLPAEAPRDLRHLRKAKKPSDSTLESIEWWDAWEASNAGRLMLTRSAYDLATAMAASARAMVLDFGGTTITMADLLGECQTEVTVRWVDEETGILCKLRADLYAEELQFAADLKSCLDASREAFSRAVFRHRYHAQHAHYCEGFRAAGAPLRSFFFLPVEKDRPHVPAAYHLDPPAEERGWEIRQRSMRKLAHCLKTGEWPGHTRAVESLSLPAFAFYDNTKESNA